MKTLTPKQNEYKRQRKAETDKIEKFRIHFSNMEVECGLNEPFRIYHDHEWSHSADIKIDVYDLRVGDKVDICGSLGVVTKIVASMRQRR